MKTETLRFIHQHDGLEKKHGWYLERIEITDMETELTWVFWCKNWLSLHIKDYQIRRDLYAKEKEMAQCGEWEEFSAWLHFYVEELLEEFESHILKILNGF